MYKFGEVNIDCVSWTIIEENGGQINENQDGTVSVYVLDRFNTLMPLQLSKYCCETLVNPNIPNPYNYFFDINTQTCRWSTASTSTDCVINNPFKLILNPVGNNGSIFSSKPNETCNLIIDFDYLFKIKCSVLNDILLSPFIPTPFTEQQLNEIEIATNSLIELTNNCNNISYQIDLLREDIKNIPYVIFCDVQPNPEQPIPNPEILSKFTKSAFGGGSIIGVAPFSFALETASGSYCLTEPAGLSAWANILGVNKYQQFLNCGSSNNPTFNCAEVQLLLDQNISNELASPAGPKLFQNSCITNFGVRVDKQKELNDLLLSQNECNNNIAEAEAYLTSLTGITATISPCTSPIDFFETFNVSMTLDIIVNDALNVPELVTISELPLFPSTTTTDSIGVNNLYSYLVSHPNNSGFYVYGEPTTGTTVPLVFDFDSNETPSTLLCDNVGDSLLTALFDESELLDLPSFQDLIPINSFNSEWLHYHSVISDPNIISAITNNPIKISIKINHACGDFCVLIDNIVLGKECSEIVSSKMFVTKSPGFSLDRVRDNKKSWVANDTRVNRPFSISNNLGNNSIRSTNYDVNDERLIINSKEIDLDISIASAIETDVWCYISDNPCLLTGITTCDPCQINCGNKSFQDDSCFDFMDDYSYDFMDGTGNTFNVSNNKCCGDNMINFELLMTQPLSSVTTVEDFEYFLSSELIDAKNRQTISGYPTLRALYDRYMNSGLYCGSNSSKFDYVTMEKFSSLIDNYWVDLVEQVIPATTIWGSVKIYSNTIFDQQKHKYKKYSSLFCGNPFIGETVLSPINGVSGLCENVEVITMTLSSTPKIKPPISVCNKICISQMNMGSEFIGTVAIIAIDGGFTTGGIKPSPPPKGSGGIQDGSAVLVVIENEL